MVSLLVAAAALVCTVVSAFTVNCGSTSRRTASGRIGSFGLTWANALTAK
jgi:hypothetical protein